MRTLFRALLTREASTLALLLTALGCLPFALRKSAPDAAMTLLLPVVLAGALIGFAASDERVRRIWFIAIFLGLGPVLLFARVGQLSTALIASLLETLRVMSALMLPSQMFERNVPYILAWLATQSQLSSEVVTFAQRIGTWLVAAFRGMPIDDPAARAYLYGLGMWLLAGWASWRIQKKNDPFGGLFPASIVLALILARSGQDPWPLWLYLSAFLLLLGIANISRLLTSWKSRQTDFSDSIPEDTILSAVLMAIVLITIGYTVSVFSLKDLLDRFREHQRPTATSSVGAPNRSARSSGGVSSGITVNLQSSHRINAGPNLSQDVVMFISTGELPPMQHAVEIRAPRYYWRSITYQTYTGSGWKNPPTAIVQVPANTQLISAEPANYRKVHTVVTIPTGTVGGAYWTGALVDSDIPLEVAWRGKPALDPKRADPDPLRSADLIGAAALNGPSATAQSYSFDSWIPPLDEAALQASREAYPAWVSERYLQLPESVPERVRALARDLTAHARTPLDRALAIESYLRKIPYSLKVPAPPGNWDAADYFLFDLKKGYCDYYATAMAVLARSVGLPARLVLGYASGSYDPYAAQYVVTQADAHAWTEIYFAGIGWIEFEPTANQPLPWSRQIGVREASRQPQVPANGTGIPLPDILRTNFRQAWWLLGIMAALLLLWPEVDAWHLSYLNPDEALQSVYARLRRLTRPINGIPPMGQTAREYAGALTANVNTLGNGNPTGGWFLAPLLKGIAALTELYMQSLFGPKALTQRDSRRAIRVWLGVRWRLALINVVLALRHTPFRPAGVPSRVPEHPAR